jgi:hypothetical protein
MDSTSSPKMKIMKEKGVGACSLAHSTSGVEGHAGAPRSGLGRLTNNQLLTRICTNQTTSWLIRNSNIFGAQMNHEQIWTHKTHHGPNLGETITFPLRVYFVSGYRNNTQMSFCLETPRWESWNYQSWDSHNFGTHNFVWRPLIEVMFEAKL